MRHETAALFRQLTLGVYVVGVAHGEERDAFTAAWIMQSSFEPLLLALSINPQNASYPLLRESRAFAVSVLKQGQLELARHFGTQSARDVDKLTGIPWRPGRSGAPVLQAGLAYFDCELTASMQAGDHAAVGRGASRAPPGGGQRTRTREAQGTAMTTGVRASEDAKAW